MTVYMWDEHYWGKDNAGFQTLCNNTRKGWKAHAELGDWFRDTIAAEEHSVKEEGKLIKHAMPDLGIYTPLFHLMRQTEIVINQTNSKYLDTIKSIKENEIKTLEENCKQEGILMKESPMPKLIDGMAQAQVLVNNAQKRSNKKDKKGAGMTLEEALANQKMEVERFEEAMLAFTKEMNKLGIGHVNGMRHTIGLTVKAQKKRHAKCLEALVLLEDQLNEYDGVRYASLICETTCTGSERPSTILASTSPIYSGDSAADRPANPTTQSNGSLEARISSVSANNIPRKISDGEAVGGTLSRTSTKNSTTGPISDEEANDVFVPTFGNRTGSTSNSTGNTDAMGPANGLKSKAGLGRLMKSFGDKGRMRAASIANIFTTPNHKKTLHDESDDDDDAVPESEEHEPTTVRTSPNGVPPVNDVVASPRLVDEEGYTIRENPVPLITNEKEGESDSDSSSEEEGGGAIKPKFIVRIREDDEKRDTIDISEYKLKAAPEPVKAERIRERKRDNAESHHLRELGRLSMSFQTPSSNDERPAVVQGDNTLTSSNTNPFAPVDSTLLVEPFTPSARGSGDFAAFPPRKNSSSNPHAKLTLTETINAYFKGPTLGKVMLTGQLMGLFPLSILQSLTANHTPMSFKLLNMDSKCTIVPNDKLPISIDSHSGTCTIEAAPLLAYLQAEHAAQAKNDLRINIFSYTVTSYDISLVPLRLCSIWKPAQGSTTYLCHYMYNNQANPVSLSNVSFLLQLAGGPATECQATPEGAWNSDQQRLLWTIPTIGSEEQTCRGAVQAVFTNDSPITPSKTMIKMSGA
eukprot:Ihof_evm6s195 gene=Ihof_evmTU6s195